MKIGIMAYRQAPYISANTAIAYTVGDQIVNKGHEVVYIGYKQDKSQNKNGSYKGNKILYFNEKITKNPNFIKKIANKLFGDRFRLRQEVKSIKKIVFDEKIDALICVFAPLEDALIAYYAKLDIPVLLYQLDPFYNSMDVENPKLKKLFLKIVENATHLFTTDLLYDEYSKDEMFQSLLNKISVLQFPKLQKSSNSNKINSNNKIRLLYAGTLYKQIRSPKILLNLQKNLPNDCELIFCGSCDDESDMKALKDSGIICLGYCDQDVLKEENEKADVLVNIGNLVRNQLGSKIVDYISTGKPILNISQFEQCPTIRVLDDYRYKCNVLSKELDKDTTKKQIEDFLYIKDKMNWGDILQNYIEYTPEFVANKIINVIDKKEI